MKIFTFSGDIDFNFSSSEKVFRNRKEQGFNFTSKSRSIVVETMLYLSLQSFNTIFT